MVLFFAIPISLAADPSVEISRSLYERLQEPAAEKPVSAPGIRVAKRDLVVVTNRENLLAVVEWDVVVAEPGWVDLPLVVGRWDVHSVAVNGRAAEVVNVDGVTRLVRRLERDARITLRAQRPGTVRKGGDELVFLAAAAGTVEVRTNDAVQRIDSDESVVRAGDQWWTGAGRFTLTTEKTAPERRRGQEVIGAVGIGVTVGDDAVRTSARVAYRISTGSLSTVAFDVSGAGADLDVTGPMVKSWSRSGSRVDVVLTRPETRLVELEVRMSTALADDDQVSVDVPVIQPVGTYRTEQAIQLARDGDREIAPQMKGWTAVATSELPRVARGLVEGTPTSAWTAAQSGGASMNLLRFEPVSGPPTFVDVAAWYGATSRDGRTLLRGHLTVRNDRGDFLRMKLAPGQRLISARVGDAPARVARDGDTLLLPLLKSLETVEGLLDFPVHVVILSEGAPFDRRDERVIAWPTVDAPVAVSRVELALPIGWESQLEHGEQHVVDAFSDGDGISYGFTAGDGKVEQADQLYQQALSAYMVNDFEVAQDALDGLRVLGGLNDNVSRLQSNLDVVLGGAEADAQLGRRVKDQARARAVEEEREQIELEEEADELLNAGDYEAAEDVYGRALAIGKKLERLEQKESREVQQSNLVVQDKLAKAKKARAKRPASKTGYKERTVLDFEDVDVTGELVKQQGQFAVDRKRDSSIVSEPAQTVITIVDGDLVDGVPLSDVARRRLENLARAPHYSAPTELIERLARDTAIRNANGLPLSDAPAQTDAQDRSAIDTSATSRGQVLTKEFLSRVTSERSYEEASELVAGSGQDGTPGRWADVEKPQTPYRYGAPDPVPEVVVTEVLPMETTTLQEPSRDLQERVPSGRSYQTAAVSGSRRKRSGRGVRLPNLRPRNKSESVPDPGYSGMADFNGSAANGEFENEPPIASASMEPSPIVIASPKPPRGGKPAPPSAPPPPPPPVVPAFEPLDVTAASRDIVVPTFGEVVRYQHLILPSGTAPTVRVVAKAKRGTR